MLYTALAIALSRFDAVVKMNAGNSIIKLVALKGTGNVLPDPCSEVCVKLNSGCFCGHYAARMNVWYGMVSVMAAWRAGLAKRPN